MSPITTYQSDHVYGAVSEIRQPPEGIPQSSNTALVQIYPPLPPFSLLPACRYPRHRRRNRWPRGPSFRKTSREFSGDPITAPHGSTSGLKAVRISVARVAVACMTTKAGVPEWATSGNSWNSCWRGGQNGCVRWRRAFRCTGRRKWRVERSTGGGGGMRNLAGDVVAAAQAVESAQVRMG